VAGCALAILAAAPAAGQTVRPFQRLDCVPTAGVRFCEGSVAKRVPSFDGVPLDVNVTLPASNSRNLPLVIQLHGWGESKSGLGAATEWATQGYAVLSYTARGFGQSCGSAASRALDPSGCARGWIHLADARYEGRDSQYLAGLLADQGIVAPRRIGVTGGSYGGGQALTLATLRDRVRRRDGSYIPWRSPKRKLRMRIAAAAPYIPWSDLVYALTPNGGTLDTRVTGPRDDLSPLGVMKQSWNDLLYGAGSALGFYAPEGVDPQADITGWIKLIRAGEPYDSNPLAHEVAREIARHHSPYYLNMSERPAPTLISNGFTDDLFPVDEAVRYANKVFRRYPHAALSQIHFDWGHPRGQSKEGDTARLARRTHEWFDRYVKGGRRVSVLRGVEAMTQTCPKSAPSGGPFRASTWDRLSPGELRFAARATRTVLSSSGDSATGLAVDPIGGAGACATVAATDAPGTATYRLPAATGGGFTLLGAPSISARFKVSGREPALALRLWDVSPAGTQTLVARGLYRPRRGRTQVLQLHPGAWRFAPGHVPKLELVGRDVGYARPSNFAWSIAVSDLRLRLPVHERPGGAVKKPKRPFRR
jgi:Acetyl xylan esterase (AXE1)